MTKEKLIEQIMKEAEKDGEPVTKEEATEMAEMEIKANSDRHYEKSDKPRKKSTRERKIDATKANFLAMMSDVLETKCTKTPVIVIERKIDSEFTFRYNGDEYTVKLIKHRPQKS